MTDHFAPLAANYDAILSDVWGVIHNGIAAFPEPAEAPAASAKKAAPWC